MYTSFNTDVIVEFNPNLLKYSSHVAIICRIEEKKHYYNNLLGNQI